MALLEEQFTETLDAGAPDITYQGNEGQEQKIARELWDQLPPEAQQQFGNFQQFFSSGAWKQVLQMLQQQMQQQAPQQMAQQPQQPQQGLGSMMPAQMADGGRLMASAPTLEDSRNEMALQLFGKPLHQLTEDELQMMDEYNQSLMAYGGIAGPDGRRAYGWGSKLKKAFKKVTKPFKKIAKSPIGKAALLYAGTAGLGNLAGGLGGATKWGNMFGPGGWMRPSTIGANWLGTLGSGGSRVGQNIGKYIPGTEGILGKLKLTEGFGTKMPTALGWGAAASLAPFAMSAAGKWDTGEQEIDNLKAKAAEFGFDYSQMIEDLQTAVATGSEAELAKVLSNYNLSRGDMSAAPYIGTAAEGGRIGYAEGGWEVREKQDLISRLVGMGLPLPQAMKMAEMIIANATPEELRRTLSGTRHQGLTPEESIKFQENIITPDEDIDLTGQVSRVFPLDKRVQAQPVRRNINQALMARMQRAPEEFMDSIRDPRDPSAFMDSLRDPRASEETPFPEITPYGAAEGGLMSLGGNEMDLRGGGFVPIGAKEKADDVPARLSKNEFVFTADAVRAAGDGDVDAGADKMYNTMKQLENRVGS